MISPRTKRSTFHSENGELDGVSGQFLSNSCQKKKRTDVEGTPECNLKTGPERKVRGGFFPSATLVKGKGRWRGGVEGAGGNLVKK